MADLDLQRDYWNGEGAGKTFSHPLPLDELCARLAPQADILDYGCGYGRAAAQLVQAGFSRVVGVDISEALLARGRREHPDLDLRLAQGIPLPFADASFDACLLVAVLTCVPTEAGAEAVLAEVRRLLRPGGLLLLSDYPFQPDARNIARYRQHEAEFGIYGVFRTGGAVCRHFAPQRLDALLSGFTPAWRRDVDVPTMNGNPARITQAIALASGR
ncbi:Methyltransferase domain-containing protein [Humidesulfovibrio mexicanus]|uniref:Methyltransferase domain-containing protein n=1 Tax=Humidesulfovibrio mexicanus TaxID=147047 RepID=A0A239CAN3_9BACT|nr:class I SAM-dependent methyltransferase [Humidesulfovibrio mexicanus]SNS17285.1 Methyltransferase domain-containing protein [Humidesulfovibrio mexicanus]